MGRLNLLLGALVALGGIVAATSASAQTYPSRPIKLIVPITAGSGTDVLTRALADRLAVALGQPVVVENRPGAGGAVGATFVTKAAPDGYTLLATSSALTVAPAIYPNLSYDPIADLAGVTLIADLGAALVTPGQITYGSSGTGSASHLTSERFRTAAGFEGVHVPYRGAPEAITDAMTGRIDFLSSPLAAALPLIKDNKLVALAVPAKRRSSLLPDVPTIVEAGVPAAGYETWVGVLAPKNTPRDVVNRLNLEIVTALQTPELRAQIAATSSDARFTTPEAFDALIKDEVVANRALAHAAGIRASQ
jgi:tripartite-type tricarboxylate transporter receptor subunit TctC